MLTMSACCNRVPRPIVLDPLLSPSAELQAPVHAPRELLDETLCSEPPLTNGDLGVLLAGLRHRQEQLFERVLEQQQLFQGQLAAIQSDIKANSNAQEYLVTQFRDISSKATDTDVLGKAAKKDANAAIIEYRPTSSDAETTEDRAEGMDKNESYTLPENSGQASGLKKSLRNMQSKGSLVDIGNETLLGRMRKNLNQLLLSTQFEILVAMAIMMNAVVMCWECQYQGLDVGFNLQYPGRAVEANVVWRGAPTVFNIFDWLFGCLFLGEMIVKLAVWHGRYFFRASQVKSQSLKSRMKDVDDEDSEALEKRRTRRVPCMNNLRGVQWWNLLDGSVVIAFVFDKIAAAGLVNPQMLRLLRLLRLGRLVRLLRFLEGLDHLYVMTTAISGLTKVLGWAIVLLTVMLLTCDLFLVQMLQATYFDSIKASDLTEDQLKKHREMYEYFGTCTRCMLSMYEITLGNWPPIARLLSEEVSEWFILVCLVHKLTIGFAVVGVITGCILQETFKVAQTDDIIMFRQKARASRVFKRKMEALFEAIDISQDGRLEVSELISTLGSNPEIKIWLSSLNIETEDLNTLFDLIDVDGDGFVTLDELLARMPRLQGTARSIDVLAMMKAWSKDLLKQQAPTQQFPSEANTKSSFTDFLLQDFLLGLPQKVR